MKRIADTSRVALDGIRPDLPAREAEVFAALQSYWHAHRIEPTSYELLKWMQITAPHLDLNSVRPRLTGLRDAGRVHTNGKRVCLVTEKRVYTWGVATEPIVVPEPVRDDSAQSWLF